MMTVLPKRCAIYTRKSNDERTDAAFTTLENQREYCSAYIRSQAGEGWSELSDHYDDGGFSGGTLNRPALKTLKAEIAKGAVDIVVVYKIDRLSRSLRDFANLVAEFEASGVTFVSVTQSFDTSTSMGRLTLNVLLSFAQFEREMTGERLRDWFAGARKRGLWVTGPRPFGYRVDKLKLIVDEDEASIVRHIYARYPKVGSSRSLARELTEQGHLTHTGTPPSQQFVLRILKNRLYRGEIVHRGVGTPGQHDPIVTERDWSRVQAALAASARRRAALVRAQVSGALKGLLFTATGHVMMHTFVHRPKGTYRYYVSRAVALYGHGSSPEGRFRASDLEGAVVGLLSRLLATPPPNSGSEVAGLIRRMVARVEVGPDEMIVKLQAGGEFSVAHAGQIRPLHRKLSCKP